jgi:hypothetical protein
MADDIENSGVQCHFTALALANELTSAALIARLPTNIRAPPDFRQHSSGGEVWLSAPEINFQSATFLIASGVYSR